MSERWPGGIVRATPVTPAGPFENGAAPGMWTLDQANYWIKQGLWPTAGLLPPLYVENVFSTYIYSGNSSAQTITNGIDLAGEGGMVWTKDRISAYNNVIVDSERSLSQGLITNNTNPNTGISGDVTSFNSNGYSLNNVTGWFNNSGDLYVSWTFRKAPKFFDVVTYTGDGTAGRQIAHSLGVAPGCIIVKRTDTSANWQVYHRSLANTACLLLNTTDATFNGVSNWNSTTPTATEFTLGGNTTVNASGGTYVAYLFAHDATSDGIIQCGSYTGNGSTPGPSVNLGWVPQWVLVKNASAAANWSIIDNIRGFVNDGGDFLIYPNLSDVEASADRLDPIAGGFFTNTLDAAFNTAGNTYIYVAIRSGQMQTPTLGTTVFQPVAYNATNVDYRLVTTNILTDMVMARVRDTTSTGSFYVADRLRGNYSIATALNAVENGDTDSYMTPSGIGGRGNAFSAMDGFGVGNDATRKLNYLSNPEIAYAFRRATGFMDVVCYTGTGVARTVSHNLGAVPELMIVKSRTQAEDWWVYSAATGATNALYLNGGSGQFSFPTAWNSTSPTSAVFSLGTLGAVNTNLNKYVAYLFATCPGVSKVGSYTGNGSSQTINCGFAAGARFVMIKRTDSTGDWYVWDTARGIVAGNDPYLLLNSTAAEVTSTDYIDTDNSGFQISSTAPAGINANGGTYIFLAVA